MLNSTIIQGRLTRDPELRHTQSGTEVASFTVAWSEKYKEQERKLFLPCVAWGAKAGFVSKWFKKGAEIVISGKLGSRSWVDKNGNSRETVELTADEIHFCGKRETQTPAIIEPEATEPQFAPIGETQFEELTLDDSELPF